MAAMAPLQLPNDASPFLSLAEGTPPAHSRTYQACIPCRRRKVRCDLGPVDNPHDPPCVRCRRESKECFFSQTRRKKRATDSGEGSEVGDGEQFEIRRKRLKSAASLEQDVFGDDADYEEPPLTPGGSKGRLQPLRRPSVPKQEQYTEEDEEASNQTAAILQAAEMHNGHDALKVLYEASVAVHGRTGSGSSARPQAIFSGLTPSSLPTPTSPIASRVTTGNYGQMSQPAIDPAITGQNYSNMLPTNFAHYAEAVKAWSRFRFVRAGWFTAHEGIAYIAYFYRHLSPLTPIAPPDFRSLDSHAQLLTKEPMLTVTMLLTASRHMKLDGPGSLTRPYSIHQKLWTYLQGMIDRVVWGQEQHGGGFCGAGSQPGHDVNPLTRKGLRTVGTVESMMILTEWHPRAMHFPPDEDDDELMTQDMLATLKTSTDDSDDDVKGIGGQRLDSWLEPCWRSDRMCWMLLGMAMSLAFEIGVFDHDASRRHWSPTGQATLSEEQQLAYDKRRDNVKNLLLIYVTQTSGRLGLTSMLPQHYSEPTLSDNFMPTFGYPRTVQETVVHFWLRMAAIMKTGNQKLFQDRSYTRQIIRDGSYRELLNELQPQLLEWKRSFDECTNFPPHMRHILEIEYEYTRVYINSLPLQALVERCASKSPMPFHVAPVQKMRSAISTNGLSSDNAIAPAVLAQWLGNDRDFIDHVSEAARNLLRVVVDGLAPGEYLKHAPVRTYFRIVQVAIILLKTFSIGVSESTLSDSMILLERTVDALRTCIVDDVHVASRFADLLHTLTQNMRPRLVRMAGNGGNGRSRRASNAPELVRASNFSTQAQPQQQAKAGANNNQQYNFNISDGIIPLSPYRPAANHNSNTPSGALYGISNQTYDLTGGDNNYSIMPPPMFGMDSPTLSMNMGNGSTFDPYATNNFSTDDGSLPDWFALPLDPLMNVSGADINASMYGPEFGGHDMLEVLFNGTSGHNGQNGNFQ